MDSNILNVASRAILRPIKAVLFLLGTYSAVEYTFSKLSDAGTPTQKFNFLASLIYSCILFHGLIMIYEFMDPVFRDFVYSFTTAKDQLEFYKLYRMAGLTGAGGAQVSVIQSLGFVIGLYLVGQGRWTGFYLMGNLLLIFSIIVTGRSGFISVVISVVIYGWQLINNLQVNKRIVNLIVKYTLIVLLVTSVSVWVLPNLVQNENFGYAWQTFDVFFGDKVTDSDRGGDETISTLSDMFILPESFSHLIFGRASYLEINTYYSVFTDIGYMHIIWAYGVIGLLLHLFFYGAVIAYLFGVFRRNSLMRSPALLGLILVSLILFFNVKELFFFARMSFQITMAIFIAVLLCEKQSMAKIRL
ncbi:MAG: hypothetical protein PHP85_01520 [Gallionella sp.]|nr:hypothetical protein [Gallionella sp.]